MVNVHDMSNMLDNIASSIESLGMVKEAHDLDVISNTLDSSENWANKTCKFKKIKEEGDEEAVMYVLEDRGDRVLVVDTRFKDWKIPPMSVYRKNELEIVDSSKKPYNQR